MTGRLPAAIVTLDVGVVKDVSARVVVHRLAGVSALNPGHDGRPVLAVQVHVFPRGTPLVDVVDSTVAVIEEIRPAYVAIERSGVGAMPYQEIRRACLERIPDHRMTIDGIHWSNEQKVASYSMWRWLFERRQAVLQRDPLVLRQLAGVRMHRSVRAAQLDAEDPSIGDDAADAIAFAALPFTSRGRTLCGLTRLVDPRSAPREAEVPALDEPIVETGAGLRLYRRPPLQGLTDSRPWLPPGVEVRHEHRDRGRPEMLAAPQKGHK